MERNSSKSKTKNFPYTADGLATATLAVAEMRSATMVGI